jgi:hypothetical protein
VTGPSADMPRRRTDRLRPEQRAQIRAAVAAWPPLTEAQRAKVATLFASYPIPGHGGDDNCAG